MDQLSPAESQAKTWSMVAQLAIFANMWVPFGGLIATALIYALRKDLDPIARENERNALNFEIALAIFNVLGAMVYFALFLPLFFSAASVSHAGHRSSSAYFPWVAFGAPFACMAILFAVAIAAAIVSCFAARAAWLGRVFRYPVAIPFVR